MPQPVKILVVDDDPMICEFMETLLKGDGHTVESLTDPRSAPDAVRDGGFHLVFLDLMMPHVDGIETFKRIRHVDDDVAVCIFTGFPTLDTAIDAMKLEAVDYLRKPFEPQAVRDAVDRVMRKKGLARSPEAELYRRIGDTIRGLRKDKGLTLKQMSRRTSLSVSLLSQIERAESSPSLSSLYRIAVALDSRVSELFGEF
ncbi:MAG: response regulator [Deltaproteobacteria bacterium]|nr:response regulator [Deltaproteobacteria bacterium]